MKKLLAVFLVLLLVLSFAACAQQPEQTPEEPQTSEDAPSQEPEESQEPQEPAAPENPVIRLSTTTSVNDSGLLPYLQPTFEEDTGYTLEITSAGTGAAIEKGRTGDADCLLVHAKASEEEFIEEGYSEERVPFMFNYFVIIGPADDPAGVKDAATATDAFKAIAEQECEFVSRGDDSGTHKAELKIWDAAGIDPTGEKWYTSTGQGMGASIIVASEKQAYILTDKATYLSHELKDTLTLLMEESDELKNTYSMLAISPEKWPDTNIDGANAFIEWMTSDKATELINAYGVTEYGEQLFYAGE